MSVAGKRRTISSTTCDLKVAGVCCSYFVAVAIFVACCS